MSEGVLFGDYLLLGRLAAGGMAEVYLARALRDTQPNSLLAIKRMLPRLSEDPTFVDMFNDEARIASGLAHPNICRIIDQGQHDGQLFIVMEFVHGKDLRVVKKRAQKRNEPIPARVAAFVLAKIADALDYAHRKTNDAGEPEHIIHRDISPQNILLSYDGVPKLIDFGIAKAKDRLVQTQVGIVKGKFAYMSPEQATGQTLDPRSDVFALGIVLYELLTGNLPFKGESDLSTLKRIAQGDFAAPTTLNRELPPRLSAVVERALQHNPADRYQSAGELAADLHRHLADERRELSEALLSSYIRRLFRDDYIREMGRIRDFLSMAAPPAPLAPPTADNAPPDGPRLEPTTVTPSAFLAAGYDGPPSTPEAHPLPNPELLGDREPTTQPGGETVMPAENLHLDAADVDGALLTLAEIDTLDVPAETFALSAADPGEATTAGPQQAGLWNHGPNTDRARQPTLELKPEPLPSAAGEPSAAPFAPATEPAQTDDEEPTAAFSGLELRAMMEATTVAPDLEPATRELLDHEIDSMMTKAAKLSPAAPTPMPDDGFGDLSSVELDSAAVHIEEPRPESTDFDIQVDDAPAAKPRSRRPLTERPPSPSSPVSVTPEPPNPTPLTPIPVRRRLLTSNEIAVLFLAAALGLASVAGAFWIASRTPPTRPPSQTLPLHP